VIVLDRDLRAVSWTAGAREWAHALPAASMFSAWGVLPPVMYPAAVLARSGSNAKQTHAMDRTVDGRWVKIEAAPLDGEDGGRVAVVLRGAAPAETFELLCRAYAFTTSERHVVAALVAGDDTRAITQRLAISRHTVQDHLKSIFARVGVRSRREVLARFNGATETTSSSACAYVVAPSTYRLTRPHLTDVEPEAGAAARTHCTSRRLIRRSADARPGRHSVVRASAELAPVSAGRASEFAQEHGRTTEPDQVASNAPTLHQTLLALRTPNALHTAGTRGRQTSALGTSRALLAKSPASHLTQ
jgi:DNA-binding CsgD family transcriptional regulator